MVRRARGQGTEQDHMQALQMNMDDIMATIVADNDGFLKFVPDLEENFTTQK